MAAARELPPGPRRPLAFQTLRYGVDPYGFFESAHRAFGDVFTVRAMGETWVILAHSDAAPHACDHAARRASRRVRGRGGSTLRPAGRDPPAAGHVDDRRAPRPGVRVSRSRSPDGTGCLPASD